MIVLLALEDFKVVFICKLSMFSIVGEITLPNDFYVYFTFYRTV